MHRHIAQLKSEEQFESARKRQEEINRIWQSIDLMIGLETVKGRLREVLKYMLTISVDNKGLIYVGAVGSARYVRTLLQKAYDRQSPRILRGNSSGLLKADDFNI